MEAKIGKDLNGLSFRLSFQTVEIDVHRSSPFQTSHLGEASWIRMTTEKKNCARSNDGRVCLSRAS